MPRLVVHEAGGVATSMQVEGVVQIGRGTGMQVALGDDKVSPHHATISREADGWIIADAESRHGTFVNGHRVARQRLHDGDELQIGSTVLRFEEVEDAAEVALRIALHRAPTGGGADTNADADADADAALQRALAAIVAMLGCECGVIALGASPHTLRLAAEVHARELVIGRAVIDAVMTRGEAVLLDSPGNRSAMAAPLRLFERTLGLVYIDDRGRAHPFAHDDLARLVAIARLTGAIAELSGRYERAPAPPAASLASQFAALDETERRLVEEAMAKAGGNVSEAARLLGITRIMMKRRLDRFANDAASGGAGGSGSAAGPGSPAGD